MTKLLLFDIDGTLLLTGGVGIIAFEKAFHELFSAANAWGNMIPDGKTDPDIIDEIGRNALKRSLTQKEHGRLAQRYLFYFEKEILNAPRFRLMPGVFELLEHLSKRRDFLLGIASGNLEGAGWLKLKRGGIEKFFSLGGFGSDSRERSELTQIAIQQAEKRLGSRLQKDSIFLIGDTYHDVRAARKLGVKVIAVTTGSMKKEHFLGEDKPDYLLPDLTNLEHFTGLIG